MQGHRSKKSLRTYVSKCLHALALIVIPVNVSSEPAAPSVLKPWVAKFQKNLPAIPPDHLSNAEPEKAVTTHLVWSVTPDFPTKRLSAVATYTYDNKIASNDRLALDVSNLEIESITIDGNPAHFEIRKSEVPNKPDALYISVPAKVGPGKVVIKYRTSDSATGVFWVDKQYTNGQQHPLMYTLFYPNEGASVIPGQHSPGIRLTFEVNAFTNSPDLMALSSVMNNPKVRRERGDYVGLKMDRAVPLYLLSLNVGNFAFKGYEEDPRTGVYSEEVGLEAVAAAFIHLPRALKGAEEVCGPYNWREYNAVLLSKGFPYMAMEHPCASTFGQICMERPTVVTHELSHSWTGNDITNCNWRQFFWNEGATTFMEFLLCERLFGTDYAAMEMIYTLEEMREAMDEYRNTRPDLLRLCQETDDLEFTRIPYGKGALFFFMLRKAMGTEIFAPFFKDYMKVFYQNTMSEERFLAFLRLWLKNEQNIQDFDKFLADHQINDWLHGLEIPSNAPTFHSSLVEAFHAEKAKILQHQPIDLGVIQTWDVTTTVNFLSSLTGHVDAEHIADLDRQLNYTASTIMSIRQEWSRLCATTGYITPQTRESIARCVIDRNSVHMANQICTALKRTAAGREVLTYILEIENGALFPITRKKVAEHLN